MDDLRFSPMQMLVLRVLAAIPPGNWLHTTTVTNHASRLHAKDELAAGNQLFAGVQPSAYPALRKLEDRGFVVRAKWSGRTLLWRLGPMSDALKERGLL